MSSIKNSWRIKNSWVSAFDRGATHTSQSNGIKIVRKVSILLASVLLLCSSACNRNTDERTDPLASVKLSSTTLSANGTSLQVEDIARDLGLDLDTKTWTARTYDVDGDGKKDLLIGRHAEGAALLFRNTGQRYQLLDDHTFLSHVDRHDCAFSDVDRDGNVDVYCSVGAGKGTKSKLNELWMKRSDSSSYENRAEEYGVSDPLGRGRHVLFFDVNHDGYPDLFVGNDTPRPDGKPTPNRLFINESGKHFRDAPEFGLDEEVGEFCTRTFDMNHDGWEDLLVCGQGKPPLPLRLYQNIGGKKFENVSIKMGISSLYYSDALFVDLNNDNRIDLAMVRADQLDVQLQQKTGVFSPPITILKNLSNGMKLAAGDADGDGDQDLYVLQGCLKNDRTDHPDGLLLNDGTGVHYVTLKVPQPLSGCGDTVVPLDPFEDRKTDFLVLNGMDVTGNIQVIALRVAKQP